VDSGRPSLTSVITTAAFLCFVVVDVAVPARLVSGAWWLVLFLVWMLRWPTQAPAGGRATSPTPAQLLALPVFAWLFFRAVNGFASAASAWEVLSSDSALALLSFPMQDTLVGLVTAVLLAIPIRRTFGARAASAACLVVLPYFMLAGLETVFVPARWAERPLANAIHLFEAVMPPLLLLEACALRIRDARDRKLVPRRLQFGFDRVRRGELGAAATALGVFLPVAGLTAAAIALRVRVDGDPDAPLVIETLAAATIPLVTVALTAAGIALLRALRAVPSPRGCRLWLIRDLKATVFLLLGPLWLWTVLIDAPQTGAYAKGAVRSLPRSTWEIVYDASSRTIRLDGEFQAGIARDFIRVLDAAPDAETVELQSPGGWVGEAVRIAEQIERRELATRVVSQCSSACTLAFAGGVRRTLAPGAALGFHAGSAATGIGDGNREINAYMLYRGIDPQFLLASNAVPPRDIWVPDLETLRSAGVLTD